MTKCSDILFYGPLDAKFCLPRTFAVAGICVAWNNSSPGCPMHGGGVQGNKATIANPVKDCGAKSKKKNKV
ncbi:MAG: hypothetical protein ABJB86_02970 [Bacteroidota bacterium]